jgi:hypothetical protein
MKTTKRQAMWLWIAEAFGTPYKERSQWLKHHTKYGVCLILERCGLGLAGYLEWCGISGNPPIYWLPIRANRADSDWNSSCDHIRSLLACLVATLTDEEYAQIGGDNSVYNVRDDNA